MTTRSTPKTILTLAVMACCVLAAVSAPVDAATVALIDFGRDTNTTAGYNNYSDDTLNGSALALVDTLAAATGWSVAVTHTGDGSAFDAGGADVSTFPAALSGFETTALENSIASNDGASGNISELTVSITGLDNSATYDLLFYGSRGSANANQTWSLTAGTGGSDVTHDSEDNETIVVDWSSIIPDSGVITFTIRDNADTSNTNGTLALNFGSITEIVIPTVPEPSTAVLACLGLMGLTLRRRRR